MIIIFPFSLCLVEADVVALLVESAKDRNANESLMTGDDDDDDDDSQESPQNQTARNLGNNQYSRMSLPDIKARSHYHISAMAVSSVGTSQASRFSTTGLQDRAQSTGILEKFEEVVRTHAEARARIFYRALKSDAEHGGPFKVRK